MLGETVGQHRERGDLAVWQPALAVEALPAVTNELSGFVAHPVTGAAGPSAVQQQVRRLGAPGPLVDARGRIEVARRRGTVVDPLAQCRPAVDQVDREALAL